MPDVYEEDRRFIRDGCLVMLLAMAWDVLDGSGTYLLPYLDLCRQAITQLEGKDEKTARLTQAVNHALEAIKQGQRGSYEMDLQDVWVNREYVHRYFRQKSEEMAALHENDLI